MKRGDWPVRVEPGPCSLGQSGETKRKGSLWKGETAGRTHQKARWRQFHRLAVAACGSRSRLVVDPIAATSLPCGSSTLALRGGTLAVFATRMTTLGEPSVLHDTHWGRSNGLPPEGVARHRRMAAFSSGERLSLLARNRRPKVKSQKGGSVLRSRPTILVEINLCPPRGSVNGGRLMSRAGAFFWQRAVDRVGIALGLAVELASSRLGRRARAQPIPCSQIQSAARR